MPPNMPTNEGQDDGRARVGSTGEEKMVLPVASDHKDEGSVTEIRVDRTNCFRSQKRGEFALRVRLDDEGHSPFIVLCLGG